MSCSDLIYFATEWCPGVANAWGVLAAARLTMLTMMYVVFCPVCFWHKSWRAGIKVCFAGIFATGIKVVFPLSVLVTHFITKPWMERKIIEYVTDSGETMLWMRSSVLFGGPSKSFFPSTTGGCIVEGRDGKVMQST